MLEGLWRNWIGHISLLRNVRRCTHSRKYFGSFFKKTKHTFTIQFSNCTLRHLSQRKKRLCLHKNCTWSFRAALLLIANNCELPECSLVGKVKQAAVHPLSTPWSTENELCIHVNFDETQEHFAEWLKKKNPKKSHVIWFHYITLSKRRRYGVGKQMTGF